MTADLDPDGCHHLLVAFWHLVRYDLAMGNHTTQAWLASPQFAWWAATTLPCSVDAARIGLAQHWQAAMRDPTLHTRYGRWNRRGGAHRRMA